MCPQHCTALRRHWYRNSEDWKTRDTHICKKKSVTIMRRSYNDNLTRCLMPGDWKTLGCNRLVQELQWLPLRS
jgi:hypothetical protein